LIRKSRLRAAFFARFAARSESQKVSLEQTSLSERRYFRRANDEMIEHFHFDERERALERVRQCLIGNARIRLARRMIMRKDHR
jgi:hypothetical protein